MGDNLLQAMLSVYQTSQATEVIQQNVFNFFFSSVSFVHSFTITSAKQTKDENISCFTPA